MSVYMRMCMHTLFTHISLNVYVYKNTDAYNIHMHVYIHTGVVGRSFRKMRPPQEAFACQRPVQLPATRDGRATLEMETPQLSRSLAAQRVRLVSSESVTYVNIYTHTYRLK